MERQEHWQISRYRLTVEHKPSARPFRFAYPQINAAEVVVAAATTAMYEGGVNTLNETITEASGNYSVDLVQVNIKDILQNSRK